MLTGAFFVFEIECKYVCQYFLKNLFPKWKKEKEKKRKEKKRKVF